MRINEIFLDGFRNYEDISVRFCNGINLITGNNAQGKTNLLEAVSYLSSGRSFRLTSDKDLIIFGRESASIKANIFSAGREQTLQVRFLRGRRRELFVNEVKLKKSSELAGRITTVFFGPDDLSIVKDGAAVRRKLMDQSLSQLRPGYFAALTEFNRLYEHKTRILRDYREKPSLLELLDDFNLRLAQQSARLIYSRSAFSEILARKAASIHNEFTNSAESLDVRYITAGGIQASGKKPDQLLHELIEHQKEKRQAELKAGLCLAGAHKDELEIEINGMSARKFASQGQTRTAAVSIKLAEREVHFDDRGEYPVLLLDDILSELDSMRQSFILGSISKGQVLITCCDEEAVSAAPSGKIMRVEKGKITELRA